MLFPLTGATVRPCSGAPLIVTLALWLAGAAHADELRLILNDPVDRARSADQCDVELCTSLVALIDGATTSVDLALYGLRRQSAVLEALRAAKARGVRLRGVVDMDANHETYYADTLALVDVLGDVTSDYLVDYASVQRRRDWGGAKYRCDRPVGFEGPLQCLAMDLGDRCWVGAHASRDPIMFTGDIMHDKFAVVDARYVWTGSTNVSDSGTGGYNANLVTVIDSPVVAGWYSDEFGQLHAGQFHDRKLRQLPMRADLGEGVSVQVLFSPQHKPITEAVRPIVQGARSSIDIAVFFLTHKALTQDLIDAHNRGVQIRVLLDATGASNEYSKHEILRAAGIPVKVEGFGGKMHAKSAVVDGEILITGSMNWTSAGEGGNDENTVIIHSYGHALQYANWFQTLWERVDDRWLAADPDPESRDSGTSCTDGSDNDFDGLIDAEDPGCSAEPPPMPPRPGGSVVPKQEGGCMF